VLLVVKNKYEKSPVIQQGFFYCDWQQTQNQTPNSKLLISDY
jgi:hypothetical protein